MFVQPQHDRIVNQGEESTCFELPHNASGIPADPPDDKEVICYGAAIGTRIRDGAQLLGINVKAASIPDDPIVEGERDTIIAFDENPAENRSVLEILEGALRYVQATVIPSLKPWLV